MLARSDSAGKLWRSDFGSPGGAPLVCRRQAGRRPRELRTHTPLIFHNLVVEVGSAINWERDFIIHRLDKMNNGATPVGAQLHKDNCLKRATAQHLLRCSAVT